MNRRLFALGVLALASTLVVACGEEDTPSDEQNDDTGVCEGIDCSGHGTCVDDGGSAACNCDDGYHASGLTCVADTASFAGSCHLTASSACIDYTGSLWTAETVQAGCTGNGTYSTGYCTSAGRVGRCDTPAGAGTGSELATSYYEGDAEFFQSACESIGGTWTAG